MKVRTLIRQLAMHDMEAQVVLMTVPKNLPTRYFRIGKVLKARPFHKGHVYMVEPKSLAGSAADKASDPSTVGTIKHDISDLEKRRRFKEVSPELAGKPANLSNKKSTVD